MKMSQTRPAAMSDFDYTIILAERIHADHFNCISKGFWLHKGKLSFLSKRENTFANISNIPAHIMGSLDLDICSLKIQLLGVGGWIHSRLFVFLWSQLGKKG